MDFHSTFARLIDSQVRDRLQTVFHQKTGQQSIDQEK
jgi:hypothetical protein